MVSTTQNGKSVSTPDLREGRNELALLRDENARLRSQIRDLRAALDAHLARSRSTHLYGPVEMTAGTCVGPRRRRHKP
jgi:hypothetical protein